MKRRTALATLGALAAGLPAAPRFSKADGPDHKSRLGLVIYCRQWLRRQQQSTGQDLFDPLEFLNHCDAMGAGGVQAALGALPLEACDRLREDALRRGMFIEAIIRLPQDDGDVSRFDAEMEAARRAGAAAVRTTIIPGRRYEYFDSLERFRDYEQRGRAALQRATPIAEKHRLPLAVENHKDHRNAERVALFEQIDSAYVGACVDTGNSVALLEDPLETVRALAPWAHSVHLKDQAVQAVEDGFLLGDIPLGQGFLDLPAMVEVLRARKPQVHFSLELITRDPLKVPCLSEAYWATFPDLPARDLARTLRQVRDSAADQLQRVDSLSLNEKVALETANIEQSLRYARESLAL